MLAPWGSIAIELGDTFAGSGGARWQTRPSKRQAGQVWDGSAAAPAGVHTQADHRRCAPPGARPSGRTPATCAKSLALIPQLYATSLAYGRNLLTGQPSPAGQWLVRNVIVWHRPNPAVGALGDKVRPSTSYITVATRSPKRWFDLDAVRTEYKPTTGRGAANPQAFRRPTCAVTYPEKQSRWNRMPRSATTQTAAGAPPLDCWFDVYDVSAGAFDEHDTWTITTQPSSLAHYAMWPAKLAERLILMMCPAEVCATCQTNHGGD